ncbi:MAG: hypothetical protein ACRCZD_12635 [Phycicoccus sp.]
MDHWPQLPYLTTYARPDGAVRMFVDGDLPSAQALASELARQTGNNAEVYFSPTSAFRFVVVEVKPVGVPA